jgi:hypothetical protein
MKLNSLLFVLVIGVVVSSDFLEREIETIDSKSFEEYF